MLPTVILLGPMVGAALHSAQVRLVPAEVLGRSSAASNFLASSLQPLAPVAAGLLVQSLHPSSTQLILAGTFILVAVVAGTLPGFGRAASRPTAVNE